ncbi:MAG: glycoside hydrolase family 43 protein, partial [Oscillospiraceae bacterium]|nr:glycoside hydrolase family 43 protein [Oscillospiraceae bacterium]
MEKKLRNPIIPGFYPDPSICRVGDDFYLVCSSFELCPGIPLFHSKDLAHWKQLCYVMTPENGFHTEKNCGNGGVMAPTIRYHNGTFYVINCNFADRGNFIVTAKDPAGPWSEPHWLDDVPGIDASIFFDDDGACYIMGTAENWPDGKGGLRQGIWAARYDIENFRLIGEPAALWGGAMAGVASPESPHLYHIGGWYYLLIAEGGTEYFHSATVARARTVFGPYEGYRGNPILTMRHMGRRAAIQNAGHADLIDLPDGSWYGVFLASRLIGGVSKNLGRETFIAPVRWEEEWPLFTPDTGRVEWEYDLPSDLPCFVAPQTAERDAFAREEMDLCWSFWGTPYEQFWSTGEEGLAIRCLPQALADPLQPMSMTGEKSETAFVPFVARRRLQPACRFRCEMTFVPEGQETAGIAVVQAMNHQVHLQLAQENGQRKLQLLLFTADYELPPYIPGFTSVTNRTRIVEAPWEAENVVLQMELRENNYVFSYGAEEAGLTELGRVDGALINPEKVGCMVGEMLGMFATGNGTASENKAVFRWAEYKDL